MKKEAAGDQAASGLDKVPLFFELNDKYLLRNSTGQLFESHFFFIETTFHKVPFFIG